MLQEQAFNSLHKGWGLLSVVGLAPDGDKLKITPFDLLYGRTITGALYGGKHNWQSGDYELE